MDFVDSVFRLECSFKVALRVGNGFKQRKMSSRMDAFSSSYSSEQVSYLRQALILSLLGKHQKSLKRFSFSNEGIMNIVRCSLFHRLSHLFFRDRKSVV